MFELLMRTGERVQSTDCGIQGLGYLRVRLRPRLQRQHRRGHGEVVFRAVSELAIEQVLGALRLNRPLPALAQGLGNEGNQETNDEKQRKREPVMLRQ